MVVDVDDEVAMTRQDVHCSKSHQFMFHIIVGFDSFTHSLP